MVGWAVGSDWRVADKRANAAKLETASVGSTDSESESVSLRLLDMKLWLIKASTM